MQKCVCICLKSMEKVRGRVCVSEGQGGSLITSTAVREKLFLWHVVLVLIGLSLLPEGSVLHSLCLGWEGSATIFSAHHRVLEACKSCRDGRL